MSRPRSAFSLIELLVVVSIIAILASMLLSGVSLVKSAANDLRCHGSLRQLFAGVHGYAEDNDGAYPPSLVNSTNEYWFGLLGPYVEGARDDSGGIHQLSAGKGVIWGCPSYRWDGNDWHPPYGMNPWLRGVQGAVTTAWQTNYRGSTYPAPTAFWGAYTIFRLGGETKSAQRCLFFDSNQWCYPITGPGLEDLALRHRGRLSTVFCDGHVAPVTPVSAIVGNRNIL